MSLQDRIEALKERHAMLERAIDEENARPLPNQEAIADLKRQKLRIKDELFQLERHKKRAGRRRNNSRERPGPSRLFVGAESREGTKTGAGRRA